MARYTVKLTKIPTGHSAPPLLTRFATWLAAQPYGSIGYFELIASPIRDAWGDADPKQLGAKAWTFAGLPDGSSLALIDGIKPAPVVYLGSEGEITTVARSFEAFLIALAAGKTKIVELDDNEGADRAALAKFVSANKVKAPSARPFNARAYLAKLVPPRAPEHEAIRKLPPNIRAIAFVVGRSVQDPTVKAEVAKLGLKLPGKPAVVEKKSAGIAVRVAAKPDHPAYPPKAGPYITEVALTRPYPGKLPFELEFSFNNFRTKRALGKPTGVLKAKGGGSVWTKPLDAARGLYFSISRGHWDPDPTVRLFIGR